MAFAAHHGNGIVAVSIGVHFKSGAATPPPDQFR